VSNDEHSPEPRFRKTRGSDIESVYDLKLIRYELEELVKRVQDDEDRIKNLEDEADDLHKKISTGKGLVYGMLIASGSMGLLLADKLKTIIGLVR
jgi:hypothetical protein